ncbi:MAG TPA: molybdate ABC transporter substrate-binding protein [Candidatus Binatia bacterium]|nr:molybdate ABC transporter substrate-binding protein [Candidatus Binatia bacterium]
MRYGGGPAFWVQRLWTLALTVAAIAHAGVAAAADPITVFAASSLTESLEEIGAAYERQNDVKVRFSFAASSLLARQIEQAAPADIFCSADQEWMDYLEQRDRIVKNSRRDLVGNRLVLVAPAGAADAASRASAPTITHATDIAARLGSSRLALADPVHVPAGRYAQDALTRLGKWDEVKDRIAPSQNVRAALALVEQGQAMLGIVYATDAAASVRVRVIGVFPENTHERILYPVAKIAGRNRAGADRFFEYLSSDFARRVFAVRGFTLP